MLIFGIGSAVLLVIFLGVQIIRYLDGQLFCKHDWEILSETTTKSKFESSMEAIGNRGSKGMPHQLCHADRKLIQIVSCKKCGKLKRFATNI